MTGVDAVTSMLAGFTVFTALGNLSETTGLPMSEVAKGNIARKNCPTRHLTI